MKKELKIIISLYENKKEHLKKNKKIVVKNFYWIYIIIVFSNFRTFISKI